MILIVYAITLIAFGLIGYCKTGSLPSLLAGTISGILLLIARNHRKSLLFLLTLVTLMFTIRAVMTYKTMPIAFALLSGVILYRAIASAARISPQTSHEEPYP
jgi:uncharacterized membrane protein (UPF0136 family)